MNSGIECIITGCGLLIPAEGKWAHGDLHMVGTCFVFNAAMHNGETEWTLRKVGEEVSNRVIILDQPYYFERRGVIIFDAMHSHFNQAARTYLLPRLKEKLDEEDLTSVAARFLRSGRR